VGLFGGKLPELFIQVERPDGVYYPGEVVRASVTVRSQDEAKFKEIRAGLLLEEKYQTIERTRDSDGDYSDSRVWRTDEQWAARESLAAGGVAAGFEQTRHFEWRLPETPLPYCQGKIVVARWLVKATVDRPLARDVNAEAPLYVVAPAPAAPAPGGEGADENSAPDKVRVSFHLPRRDFVQGETLGGRILIDSGEDLSTRAVVVSLVRTEVVTGGDRRNVEQVVEQTQQFPKVKLSAGSPFAADFALQIPAKWCPTYQSAHASVNWSVAATLDLAWKRDVHGWQVIRVFNGGYKQSQPEPGATPSFCRSCGGALAPGALFCGECGAHVARS
jgi:hypothetical protein